MKKILQDLSSYYGKDLTKQLIMWAADLIDLDLDCLKTAVIIYRGKDEKHQMPGPGKLRMIALDLQAKRRDQEQSEERFSQEDSFTPEQLERNKKIVQWILKKITNHEFINPLDCEFIKEPRCKTCMDTGSVLTEKIIPELKTKGYFYKFNCFCYAGIKNHKHQFPTIPIDLDRNEWIVHDWGKLCSKTSSQSPACLTQSTPLAGSIGP